MKSACFCQAKVLLQQAALFALKRPWALCASMGSAHSCSCRPNCVALALLTIADGHALSAPCSFTWVLHERGALQLWLAAGDVPDYALYTATWALIAPKLPELFPGKCMFPQSCSEGMLGESILWNEGYASPDKDLFQAAKQCTKQVRQQMNCKRNSLQAGNAVATKAIAVSL